MISVIINNQNMPKAHVKNIGKDIGTFRIDIFTVLGYTISNLECAITLVILNLHHFKRDSYIA